MRINARLRTNLYDHFALVLRPDVVVLAVVVVRRRHVEASEGTGGTGRMGRVETMGIKKIGVKVQGTETR